MKTWLTAVVIAGLTIAMAPTDSEAKRLGGGRPAGMQRTAPDKAQTPPAAPAATPNSQGAQAPAAAPATGAAAAAPKRSWMGPLAGLAAGIGLAALFSHLGMGEGLANFVMLALLAVVAVVAIRWLMRRFGGNGTRTTPSWAMAGANNANPPASARVDAPMARTSLGAAPLAAPQLGATPSSALAAAPAHAVLPAGFDAVAFERIAKMIFIRLQTANDKADLNDLRAFTTPELFASVRLDLQERGAAAQQTDVVTLNAELLDFAQESERQVVSVRFHGLIREDAQAGAAPFDEVWHLVRPSDDSGSWAIAGIQPTEAALPA